MALDLLYCDETNLEARAGDFFVYGGLVIKGDVAKSLSDAVDHLRSDAHINRAFALKFNPAPENLDHQQFIAVKEGTIRLAVEHGAAFLVSVILHDIATSPDVARRYEINRISYHFDCILNRFKSAGIVLIDRFSDAQIDAHLAEKFSVGVTDLPYSPAYRLSNVVGFHYSAIGQAHFTSMIDIVLGSLRFAVNAFSRNDKDRMPTAKKLLQMIAPLFYREGDKNQVSELSFFFSPKIIKAEKFRTKYEGLKAFLAECGIETAQPITGERQY